MNAGTISVIGFETARGVTNHLELKELFHAYLMHNVEYLISAVRTLCRTNRDLDMVNSFLDTLHESHRLALHLKGIFIEGYSKSNRKY